MTARRAAYIRTIAAPALTRRSLLGAAGAAAAWWVLPQARAGPGPTVIVAGAGLAGLAAALELERRGFSVQVVEARERIGGRVLTVRFPGGQHAEAGGEFIDTGHAVLRGYARQMGLPLEDVREGPDLDSVAYLRGRRRGYDSLYTGRVERALERWYEHVWRLSRRVDARRPWDGPRALDRMSVADAMDAARLRGTARALVGREEIRDDYTVSPGRVSLLFHLHFDRLLEDQSDSGSEAFRIRGGNDRLPDALAGALRGPVALGQPVTAVAQDGDGVSVTAGGRELRADFCVLALPLPALRGVALAPAPPALLAEAIERVRYGRGTKTLLRYERRFWRRRGFSGDTFTDLPLGAAWDGTDRQRGRAGVLVGYTVGRGPLARGQAARQLDRIYPGSRRLLDRSRALTWEREEFSGGTYVAFAPGQVTRYWRELRRPFGRVHLAGEHTALMAGYMEGALRSGRRAAAAVADAATR